MAGFGTAPTSPLPIVGVTIGPQWASMEVAAISELQSIVTNKLSGAQIDIGTDGELKHGLRTVRLGISQAAAVVGATLGGATIGAEYRQAASGTDEVAWDLELADNDRLREVSIYGEVATAIPWVVWLYIMDPLAGTATPFGSSVSSSNVAGRSKVTITGFTTTLASPKIYRIRWVSGAANNKVRAAEYKFDKVATP